MKKVVHIFLIVSCHFCTREKKTYSICENDIQTTFKQLLYTVLINVFENSNHNEAREDFLILTAN